MITIPFISALDPTAIDTLRGQLTGWAIAPGDPAYDHARAAFNLTVDQQPALVVMAATAGDVAAAARFAAAHGLDLAVQATGHGVIRPANGALLINLAELSGVTIDPAARTARVLGGTKWGAVLAAAQAHGLAPLLGSSPTVGAVGYTLGGGFGWLGRKYGLACDSAESFEVVTADGRPLTASAAENDDLFWGLRGGGGAPAIVTAMTIRLFPVTTVYGGGLVYPGEMAADVLRRWRDWLPTLPDEMTSAVKIMNVPDMEMAPPPLRGRTVVMLIGCHCGPVAEGAALLGHWRDWRAPEMDWFAPMPFAAAAAISQDPEQPTPGLITGAWLRALDDATVDTLAHYGTLQAGRVPLIFVEVRHAGGAVARAATPAGAFGHRDAELLLDAVGMVPAPPLRAVVNDYLGRMKADLGPALAGTVYMNFLEGEEAVARAADGFPPETLARLRALKARYDPDGRLNRGIIVN